MAQRFHKMHGLGNDFVIVDAREQPVAMDSERVRAIADRHTGVGCDQLILLEPSAVADVRMRIWNADGGEVEACGNATRCVVLLEGGPITIETAGGIVVRVLARGPLDAGPQVLTWNGRNGVGGLAYGGSYRLHVVATNELGRVDLRAAFTARR